MESSAQNASPSLKKLKREAAQRRKAQARSLKLRADEQERLQRLEIDALVEQQRLQRLERQRCEEDAAAARVAQVSSSSHSENAGGVHGSTANDGSKGGGNEDKGSSCSKLHDRSGDRDRECPSSSCVDADHNNNKKLKHSSSSCFSAAAETTAAVSSAGVATGGWRGKESQRAKHAQQQSMRAAVESRRRLARGPRSGVVPDAHPTIPSEDHRVVCTEYQAAGTQALMRVTLLAAGFVIGARGISARLIGQVTGAIVQSWTESCRPDAVPIRLFRIQGKKAVVQAAVALISQAVAKYKDLCDCKRRGEFVQREHIINGVEFYYQPPPRKAFAVAPEPPGNAVNHNGGGNKQGAAPAGSSDPPNQGGGVGVVVGSNGGGGGSAAVTPTQLSFTPHHVWLQHLHAQQQQKQQEHQQQQQQQQKAHEQAAKSGTMPMVDNQSMAGRVMQSQGFFDWRQHHSSQPQQQQQPPPQQVVGQQQNQIEHVQEHEGGDSDRCSTTELERIDQGLQQSVASLEQALQQVRLEQRLLQHNRAVTESASCDRNITNNIIKQNKEPNVWAESHQERGATGHNFQLGSSLFSIFGTGELPLPISRDGRSDGAGNAAALGMLTSPASSATPFDFLRCDFLRESLHAFPFTSRDNGPVTEYSLYGHTKNDSVDTNLCIVCLENEAGVRLMACGHSSFCFDCVQGLVNCPLCHEKVVGMHQCPSRAISAATGPVAAAQRGPPVAAKLNGSSYHLWNWIPGASV